MLTFKKVHIAAPILNSSMACLNLKFKSYFLGKIFLGDFSSSCFFPLTLFALNIFTL